MLSLRTTSKLNNIKKAGKKKFTTWLTQDLRRKFKNNTKQNLCCIEEKKILHVIRWNSNFISAHKQNTLNRHVRELLRVRRVWYTNLPKEMLNFSSVDRFIVSQMAAQEGKWVLQTHHPPVGEGREQTLGQFWPYPLEYQTESLQVTISFSRCSQGRVQLCTVTGLGQPGSTISPLTLLRLTVWVRWVWHISLSKFPII